MTQNSKRELPYIQSCACDLEANIKVLLTCPLDYLLVHDELVPNPRISVKVVEALMRWEGDVLLIPVSASVEGWDYAK